MLRSSIMVSLSTTQHVRFLSMSCKRLVKYSEDDSFSIDALKPVADEQINEGFVNDEKLNMGKLHHNSYFINKPTKKNTLWMKSVEKYFHTKEQPILSPKINKIKNFSTDVNDISQDDLEKYVYLLAVDLEMPQRLEYLESVIKENMDKHDLPNSIKKNSSSLRFLMNKSAAKRKDMNRKKMKLAERTCTKREFTRMGKNCILGRLSDSYLKSLHDFKYFTNKTLPLHNLNTIIFDLRFDEKYCKWNELVKQIYYVHISNDESNSPLHTMFVNTNMQSQYYPKMMLKRSMQNCIVTSQSYLDFQPEIKKEELIYLSPDAGESLTHYDIKKTYIIGGLVDRTNVQTNGLCYSISKLDGIASMQLPLRLYLKWGGASGRTALTINAVFQVLSTLKNTGDWLLALKHIPFRFHGGLSDYGKQVAGNRKDILDWYQKGEVIAEHLAKKHYHEPVLHSMNKTLNEYLSR